MKLSREKISNEIAWDYDDFQWNYHYMDNKTLTVSKKVLVLIKELVSRYIDREELGKWYYAFNEGKDISVQYLMNEIEPTLYTKSPFNYENYDLIKGNFIFLVATFINDKVSYIDANFDNIKIQVEKEDRDNKLEELLNC